MEALPSTLVLQNEALLRHVFSYLPGGQTKPMGHRFIRAVCKAFDAAFLSEMRTLSSLCVECNTSQYIVEDQAGRDGSGIQGLKASHGGFGPGAKSTPRGRILQYYAALCRKYADPARVTAITMGMHTQECGSVHEHFMKLLETFPNAVDIRCGNKLSAEVQQLVQALDKSISGTHDGVPADGSGPVPAVDETSGVVYPKTAPVRNSLASARPPLKGLCLDGGYGPEFMASLGSVVAKSASTLETFQLLDSDCPVPQAMISSCLKLKEFSAYLASPDDIKGWYGTFRGLKHLEEFVGSMELYGTSSHPLALACPSLKCMYLMDDSTCGPAKKGRYTSRGGRHTEFDSDESEGEFDPEEYPDTGPPADTVWPLVLDMLAADGVTAIPSVDTLHVNLTEAIDRPDGTCARILSLLQPRELHLHLPPGVKGKAGLELIRRAAPRLFDRVECLTFHLTRPFAFPDITAPGNDGSSNSSISNTAEQDRKRRQNGYSSKEYNLVREWLGRTIGRTKAEAVGLGAADATSAPEQSRAAGGDASMTTGSAGAAATDTSPPPVDPFFPSRALCPWRANDVAVLEAVAELIEDVTAGHNVSAGGDGGADGSSSGAVRDLPFTSGAGSSQATAHGLRAGRLTSVVLTINDTSRQDERAYEDEERDYEWALGRAAAAKAKEASSGGSASIGAASLATATPSAAPQAPPQPFMDQEADIMASGLALQAALLGAGSDTAAADGAGAGPGAASTTGVVAGAASPRWAVTYRPRAPYGLGMIDWSKVLLTRCG